MRETDSFMQGNSSVLIQDTGDDFGEQEVLARRELLCLVQWTQQGCSLHTVPATKTKLTSYERNGWGVPPEILFSSASQVPVHQGRV